jgi:hypothetical protein
MLMLSFHLLLGLPSGLFPSGLPNNNDNNNNKHHHHHQKREAEETNGGSKKESNFKYKYFFSIYRGFSYQILLKSGRS